MAKAVQPVTAATRRGTGRGLARDRRGGRWSKTEQRFEQHADKPKIQTLSNAKGKVDVYLPVNMFGCKAIVLLDTGCDTSLIGRNLLPTDVEITPTERTLFAANRTEITLLGEALHRVYRRRTGTLCYCRRQAIEELILGIDWLASKACRWTWATGGFAYRAVNAVTRSDASMLRKA